MSSGPETYFNALSRRNGRTWAWAAATALAVNLLFFAGMPHLLKRAPAKPIYDQRVDHVNLIHFRRPDSPVRRKAVTPPEPKPEKELPRPAAKTPAPTKMQLRLSFDINTRLPVGPGTLELPPPEMVLVGGVGLGDVFEASQLDAPLTVLTRIPPLYPPNAKQRGIEGWVTIRFLVTEDGAVKDVSVLASHPPGVFERTVKNSVSGWRFQPGTVEGIPVRTRVETTIRFELQ